MSLKSTRYDFYSLSIQEWGYTFGLWSRYHSPYLTFLAMKREMTLLDRTDWYAMYHMGGEL